jgi:hypothetical protein
VGRTTFETLSEYACQEKKCKRQESESDYSQDEQVLTSACIICVVQAMGRGSDEVNKVPVKMEKVIKHFKTHRSALDFDHSF